MKIIEVHAARLDAIFTHAERDETVAPFADSTPVHAFRDHSPAIAIPFLPCLDDDEMLDLVVEAAVKVAGKDFADDLKPRLDLGYDSHGYRAMFILDAVLVGS